MLDGDEIAQAGKPAGERDHEIGAGGREGADDMPPTSTLLPASATPPVRRIVN